MHAPNSVARKLRRSLDIGQKRLHVPLVDRTPTVPAPFVVVVVGPPGVAFLDTRERERCVESLTFCPVL